MALHRGRYGPATDPYFDLRLWLQTETRHGWVWAYNAHLVTRPGLVPFSGEISVEIEIAH